jgi:hypothetical protein
VEGLEFWWNGEVLEVPRAQAAIAQKIADGLILSKQDIGAEDFDFLVNWIGEGRVIVNEAE